MHTSNDSSYDGWCDRINAQNYGWNASGSTTAYVHTMISAGGGQFLSNDIHGAGTYTQTTIAEIKSKWGQTYLGWAQPWFTVNH
ncbi:hypothetical protein GCM10017788_22900 [Amycolatopsis acidiphila]|nr:hypothetical protein GCM10017788_22900 [Amycolatopsis acidiphila]